MAQCRPSCPASSWADCAWQSAAVSSQCSVSPLSPRTPAETKGWREGGRDGGREEGREGEREGGREGGRKETTYDEQDCGVGKKTLVVNTSSTAILVLTLLL